MRNFVRIAAFLWVLAVAIGQAGTGAATTLTYSFDLELTERRYDRIEPLGPHGYPTGDPIYNYDVTPESAVWRNDRALILDFDPDNSGALDSFALGAPYLGTTRCSEGMWVLDDPSLFETFEVVKLRASYSCCGAKYDFSNLVYTYEDDDYRAGHETGESYNWFGKTETWAIRNLSVTSGSGPIAGEPGSDPTKVVPTPLPAGMLLLLSGLAGLGFLRRRFL